jgi:hypothetical protein
LKLGYNAEEKSWLRNRQLSSWTLGRDQRLAETARRDYKDALVNQQKSIDIQKTAVKRQKITLAVAAVVVAARLGYLAYAR